MQLYCECEAMTLQERFPTWVEIDLDALGHNLATIRGCLSNKTQILLTVKADAYGHGAVQVAHAAAGAVDRFGVATVDEATELAAAGAGKPILILSPILRDEIATVVDSGFAVTVHSDDFAKRLSTYASQAATTAEVHIEVDTGMGRTGVDPDHLMELVAKVSSLPAIRLGGLFTHFPVSDSDINFTRQQIRSFAKIIGELKKKGLAVPLLHSANSAAIPTIKESHLQLVRPGLAAYGQLPGVMASDLTPIMKWKTRLVQIRDMPAGVPISYGATFTTERPTRMGVLPVGYGHGYPLRLSNTGSVLVAGKRAPVLGRVTMDMTMVDLTDIKPAPALEDEVVLLGRQGDQIITADDVAGWAGTISYELLCGVSKRVPRIYIRDGKTQMYKSLLGVTPKTVR